jgi:hypothetical protein
MPSWSPSSSKPTCSATYGCLSTFVMVAPAVVVGTTVVGASMFDLWNDSDSVSCHGMPEASIQGQSLLQPAHGRAELSSLIHVFCSPELGFRWSIAIPALVCGGPGIRQPETDPVSILVGLNVFERIAANGD